MSANITDRLLTTAAWVLTAATVSSLLAYATGYSSGRRRAQDDLSPYEAQATTLGQERQQLIGQLARQREQLARLSRPKPGKSG